MSLYNRLLAELDRREAIAKAAARDSSAERWVSGMFRIGSLDISDHIALHDPADALRRYAHYRKVLERHHSDNELPFQRDMWECVACSVEIECNSDRYRSHDETVPWPCPEVRDLADALGVPVDDGS